jgi:hypothetical protein
VLADARLLGRHAVVQCCEHREQHAAQEAPCATRDPAVCPQGWPLADFPTAFAIAIAYLLFVVIGSLAMQVRDRKSRLRELAAVCAVPLKPAAFAGCDCS